MQFKMKIHEVYFLNQKSQHTISISLINWSQKYPPLIMYTRYGTLLLCSVIIKKLFMAPMTVTGSLRDLKIYYNLLLDQNRLTEAKDILCNKAQRKNYDSWRHSGIDVPFKTWLLTVTDTHLSFHWAPEPKKEKMLESSDRKTGR